MSLQVTFRDVLRAYQQLQGHVIHTPLIHSQVLSDDCGSDVWFKMENLQATGSFKARGALNKLMSLTDDQLKKGVITASAGNHAQGLAYAASLKKVSAKIVVPENTPQTKRLGIKRLGAELIVHGATYDDAEEYAFGLAEETGRLFVNAFEDDEIIAGQGTAALEAFLEIADFDHVIVPAGGGGLLCGVALVAKAIDPSIQVIGVQTEASPPWYYSFQAGELVDVTYNDSYAEGLHGGISQANLDLALKVVDDIILVKEESIASAVYWMADQHQQMIEGSGVAGIAAFQEGQLDHLQGKKVLIMITGGNIDVDRMVQFANKFQS